jgi:DNA polymerase I-like protein with 3'-5' exonuclease and polymerase domains
MSLGEIERAIADWNDTWPDMRYFEKEVQSFQSTREGPYWVEQHGPHRMTNGWRLRMVEDGEMSAAMNTLFQGLAADGAKLAGLWLQRRCWDPTVESVLYDRARVWAFIHDEYVLEVDREVAEEAGEELSNVMEDAMDKFVPDIRIEAEPEIFHERWQK